MGIREDRLAIAAAMPHRAIIGADCLDVRLESELGRIRLRGLISQPEYEAGVRYANIVLTYLATTDAPDPYGWEKIEIPDEVCLSRKLAMSAAKHVLDDLKDRRCGRIVDRVAVYDQPLHDGELVLLQSALRALAGIN